MMRLIPFHLATRLAVCGLLVTAAPGLLVAEETPSGTAKDPPTADLAPEKETKPLSIPIPLPIGDTASDIKIPQHSETGKLLSQLRAITAKRLDDKRFELQNLVIDMNKADGKSDFRISLPISVFNTETRMIHSDQPVTITTSDFELQGARMDFDTQARRGRLLGWVYMKIHSTKELAGAKPVAAKEAPTAPEP